jgi:uncharacterized protein YoxC
MDNSGITEPIEVGEIAEKQETKTMVDVLADIAASLAASKAQLTYIASHLRLMNDSLQGIMGDVNDISITLRDTAKAVETIAELATEEISKQEQTGQAEAEIPDENEKS